MAIGEWFEVFDSARSNGQTTVRDLDDMIETYDPQSNPAAAIIGHTDDWPKDTKIPVGAWVTGLKRENTKLFAKYRYPEDLSVPVPQQFEELVGMSRFFKDAVNSGMYSKCSIGYIKPKNGGKARFHHIAYLGAVKPGIKGLPTHTFSEAPSDYLFTFNEGDDASITLDSTIASLTEIANPETIDATMTKEEIITKFSEIDPNDPNAPAELDELIKILREMYGLSETADVGQILGAVKTEKSEADAKLAGAQAVANAVAPLPLATYSDAKSLIDSLKAITETQAKTNALVSGLKAFAEATPAQSAPSQAPPQVNPTPASAPQTPPSPDQVAQTQPDKSPTDLIQQLKDAGIWQPSFDEPGQEGATMTDIFNAIQTNCDSKGITVGSNSMGVLDALVGKLSALPALGTFSEMKDFMSKFRTEAIIAYSENGVITGRQQAEPLGRTRDLAVEKGLTTFNEDLDQEILKYSETHGVDYEEAYEKVIARKK